MNNKIHSVYDKNPSIIFIDDEPNAAKYFQIFLGNDFNILHAKTETEVLNIIADKTKLVGVIVSDERMPSFSGAALLEAIKDINPDILRILVSGYCSLETNINAINKSNVFAYISKPWNIDEVREILFKAVEEFKLRQGYISLDKAIADEINDPLGEVQKSIKLIEEKLLSAYLNEDLSDASSKKRTTPFSKSDLDEILSSIEDDNKRIVVAAKAADIVISSIHGKKLDKEEFEYISANDLISKVLREYPAKEATIANIMRDTESSWDFILKGNQFALLQVLFNLIANSLHCLETQRTLTIIIGCRVVGNYNEIYITDTGPGINKTMVDNLFQPFSTYGKKYGIGLGLTFCKNTMLALGGNIRYESSETSTDFILSFPKLDRQELAQAEEWYKVNKILIVDDQQTNLSITKKKIETYLPDIICDTTKEGHEAVNLIKNDPKYKLILMDVQMEKMSGAEVTKEIRKFNKEIPIIAYSSLEKDQILKEIKGHFPENDCFNDYILKPFKDHKLCRSVSKRIPDYKDSFSYLGNKDNFTEILNGANVLLSAEQTINSLVTRRNLELYGANVFQANNTQEFVELYKDNICEGWSKFDIIIADMKILVNDAALNEIRSIELENGINYQNKIPVIALVSNNSEKVITSLFKNDVSDFFIKDSSPELLIRVVATYLLKDFKLSINSSTENSTRQSLDILKVSEEGTLNIQKINFLNEEDRKTIFDFFIEDTLKTLSDIKQSYAQNNINALHKQIHGLKGVCDNIGAINLSKCVTEINNTLEIGEYPEDEKWIENLANLHQELITLLKKLSLDLSFDIHSKKLDDTHPTIDQQKQ